MATMKPDGTFTESPRCLEGPTCCGRVLDFTASFEHLAAVLGETDTIEDAGPDWVVRVYASDGRADRVLIRFDGMRPRQEPQQPVTWSIICHLDARWAAELVAESLGAAS